MKKIAILGTAHIHAKKFLQTLKQRNDLNVIALWDHDSNRRERDANILETRAISNYNEILGHKELDAVIICSETNLHEKIIMDVTAAKKHLFVEKPIGFGREDAKKMMHAIEESGVFFQTGYFMRSSAVNRKLKELISNKAFGKISRIQMNNCHDGIRRNIFNGYEWTTDLRQSGVGAFGDLGTHVLDLLLWIFQDLKAVLATFESPLNTFEGCEETGVALLKFHSGIIATISAGWVDVAQPFVSIVSGTEGHAYTTKEEIYFKSTRNNNFDGQQPLTDLPDALPHAFDLFLDSISNNSKKNLISVREAAYNCSVIESMYKSNRMNEWVDVEEQY